MTQDRNEAYAAAAVAIAEAEGDWQGEENPSAAAGRTAVDAVWPIAEREIRAKVAAELRAALIAGERPPWAAVGNPDRAASVAEWAARIAEGGDTDGRQDR